MSGSLVTVAKRILRSDGAVYRIVRTAVHAVHAWLESTELRTGLRERKWARQRLGAIEGYWGLRNDARKTELLREAFSGFAPRSVLEVGCNCGPNLFVLRKLFPDAEFVGVDVSALAVEKGTRWMRDEGIRNVALVCAKAEELRRFAQERFDVVFSWATLIYPRPSDIQGILADMIRIARRAVILIEMQSETRRKGDAALGVPCGGEWKRDYLTILESIAPSWRVHTSWVPREYWSPGGGGGAVITAVRP